MIKNAFYRLSRWSFYLFFYQSQQIYLLILSRIFFHLTQQQILTANINTYSEVENALQPIIMAQKVRIYPYSQYDRTVCLRAELIGCIWDGEFCFSSCFESWKKASSFEKQKPTILGSKTFSRFQWYFVQEGKTVLHVSFFMLINFLI